MFKFLLILGAAFMFVFLMDLLIEPRFSFIRNILTFKKNPRTFSKRLSILFYRFLFILKQGKDSHDLRTNVFMNLLISPHVKNVLINKEGVYLNYRSNSYKTDFIIKISSAKDITNNRVVIVFHYNENGDRSYHRYAHITSKSVNNIKLSELIVKYVNDIKSKSMIDFRDLIGDIQDNDFPFSPHCGVLDDGISTYTYVYQLGDLTLDKDTIDVLENRVNTIFPSGWKMFYFDKKILTINALCFSKNL